MRVRDEATIFPLPTCALKAFTPQSCSTLWEKWCRGCNLVFCKAHADPKEHVCRSLAEPAPVPPKPDNPTACAYCKNSDGPKNGPTQDLDCEACGGHHRVCKKECLKKESKATGTFPKFKAKLKRCPQ